MYAEYAYIWRYTCIYIYIWLCIYKDTCIQRYMYSTCMPIISKHRNKSHHIYETKSCVTLELLVFPIAMCILEEILKRFGVVNVCILHVQTAIVKREGGGDGETKGDASELDRKGERELVRVN